MTAKVCRRKAIAELSRLSTLAVVAVILTPPIFANGAEPAIGRPVKVAAIAIGFGGDWEEKIALATEHLETAGGEGVDIACLPEAFAGTSPEPRDGRTAQAISAQAKKHGMYVICPIIEQAADGKEFNTALIIDRQGNITSYYRKVFVFWGENLHASTEGVKIFDLDFGKIALLTCFDANFDEVWQSAERQDAEIVFWPSAYNGGMPLQGYAMIHNYPIVAVGKGNMIDALGRAVEAASPRSQQFVATLDLDQTIVHIDYNVEKLEKLLRDHAGKVERRSDVGGDENWYVLRALKPGVRVRELCRKYDLETLREYRHRSREQIIQRTQSGQRIAVE